jgi:hypothetical protein
VIYVCSVQIEKKVEAGEVFRNLKRNISNYAKVRSMYEIGKRLTEWRDEKCKMINDWFIVAASIFWNQGAEQGVKFDTNLEF